MTDCIILNPIPIVISDKRAHTRAIIIINRKSLLLKRNKEIYQQKFQVQVQDLDFQVEIGLALKKDLQINDLQQLRSDFQL